MNVREALHLPSLAQAKVIAGSAGLDNEITSAMVLEAVDIESWGKSGQVIITSFFAIQRLTDSQVAQFFRTMASIGISAVFFKPERLLPDAPQAVIELCDDFDLPLVRLDPEVKYEAILLDVLGHVIDSNLTLLNRFYDAHRHMMALALKQPSVPYILNTLKNTLHADVTYLDTTRDRRIGTDPSLAAFTGYSLTTRVPSAYQTHVYFDARLFFEDEEGESSVDDALAVRIPSSDGVDYYLLVHASDTKLTALDVMTIENIVSLLQMEILKQNAIKQKLFFQNNNAVHDLLLGRFGSKERIDGALSMLNIDEYPFYEVLLVRTIPVDPVDIDRMDELQQAVRRRLRSTYPGIAYFINNDRILFLHNFRSPLTGFDLRTIQEILEKIHSSSSFPLFTHLATISSTVDRYSLAQANAEVISVYRLFDGSMHANRAIRFGDLGIYKLLLKADDLSQLSEYMDPRVTKMVEEQPELFETLVRLCENSLDYPKTGELLFVHPKTVRYRVDRARKLYGIDVRDSDDFLQVILTSKIIALGRES